MAHGHGQLHDLRKELKEDQVQYGLMRLSFGSGRFRRSHWVFFVWTPDEMTRNPNLTPQERGAKNKQRMLHVSYRAEMQKMLSPWNVAIVAETFEKVTIEDWLLRVRKTVVVDGNDELFTQEAILKALNEEEEYLKQLKLKEEEAKKKHLLLQQQQKEEDYKKKFTIKTIKS